MRLLFLRGNGYLFDSGKGTYWFVYVEDIALVVANNEKDEPA